jgi:hypothetical protein
MSVLLVALFNVYLQYFRTYLLASHLLDLVKGLVEVVLATTVALVVVHVVVHGCVVSLATCASVDGDAVWPSVMRFYWCGRNVKREKSAHGEITFLTPQLYTPSPHQARSPISVMPSPPTTNHH